MIIMSAVDGLDQIGPVTTTYSPLPARPGRSVGHRTAPRGRLRHLLPDPQSHGEEEGTCSPR